MRKYTDKSYRPSLYSEMTVGDILRSYDQAKKKIEQIDILRDLTLLPRKTIKKILIENGYDIISATGKYQRKPSFKTYKEWSVGEEKKLKELTKTCEKWEEVYKHFDNRTPASLRTHAYRLGLTLENPSHHHVYTKKRTVWADFETEIACELARDGATNFEIAERLGRDPNAVRGWFNRQHRRGRDVPYVIDARKLTKNAKEK